MIRRVVASLVMAVTVAGGLALAADGAGSATQPGDARQGHPTPSIVPVSWELNFRHGALERLMMPVNGEQKAFWYLRYSVINNSGRDVLFTPSFELVAETGEVSEAFKNVPNDVFTRIKELYKNQFLMSPTAIYGRLLQGEDNAKDGVIIFTDIDPEARNFQLFISGLSGETAEVKNPITGKPVILQKTLELDFSLPGQAIGISPRSELKATKWVMK
jgi:hypothetical protein